MTRGGSPLKLERLFLSRASTSSSTPTFGSSSPTATAAWWAGSARIDHAYNDHHQSELGWFGFLELEEDPELMRALIGAHELAARARLRANGRAGHFAMNDEAGVLYAGFDREPMVKQPWHPPYYQRLCEEAGLEGRSDLWMWELYIQGRDKVLPVVWELAEQAGRGIRIRRMTRRTCGATAAIFREIYNDAWKRNWGFVPTRRRTTPTPRSCTWSSTRRGS